MDKEELHQILSSLWKNDDDVGKIYYNQALQNVQTAIDLQEEPVSNDLEEAAEQAVLSVFTGYADLNTPFREEKIALVGRIFKDGVNWQKKNLWKDAQGDDLPEIDREVIALIDYAGNGYYKVVFAHRPEPKRKVSTSLLTGKKSYIQAKTYDNGGWNIPNIKYWLDAPLPKGIEL